MLMYWQVLYVGLREDSGEHQNTSAIWLKNQGQLTSRRRNCKMIKKQLVVTIKPHKHGREDG